MSPIEHASYFICRHLARDAFTVADTTERRIWIEAICNASPQVFIQHLFESMSSLIEIITEGSGFIK